MSWAKYAINQVMILLLFPEIGVEISYKLYAKVETVCMKCQSLFKNIFKASVEIFTQYAKHYGYLHDIVNSFETILFDYLLACLKLLAEWQIVQTLISWLI